MNPDKASGPDGLNPGFYQTFWDVVGDEVVKDCQSWLHEGYIMQGRLILFCYQRRLNRQV
ncbi:hypothetical protein LINPERHAP1_LOCUS26438 [Linum perenne]